MSSNGDVRRLAGAVSRIGSALPLIWLFGVSSLYLRARIYLGHWPQPSISDPKLLPFEIHHWVFMMAVYPLFATIVALPIVWLVQRRVFRTLVRSHVIAYMSGWLLLGIAFSIPGFNFVKWFLD